MGNDRTPELGALAELRFQQRCLERGIDCYAPILAGQKAVDFVIDLDDRLATVQVKKATVNAYDSCGGTPRLGACLHGSTRRKYKAEAHRHADFYAFVCLELNSVWMIPKEDVQVTQTWSKKLSELPSLDPYLF